MSGEHRAQPEPLFDRVLLKPLDDPAIWIPPGAAVPSLRAVVVAVGPTCESALDPGDLILFPTARCVQFRHEDEAFYVIAERDILVILDPAQVRPTLSP